MPDKETVATATNAATEARRLLEKDVPLSRSMIWGLQRDFYAQRGLKAWNEDLVPSYITNNPFIAEIFAGIVAAFVQDCMSSAQRGYQSLSPENPLRILELGAGTGKFSYLFLRKLVALLQRQNIPLQLVRYCMTDTSESLIAEWRSNAYLQEFVGQGHARICSLSGRRRVSVTDQGPARRHCQLRFR